MPIEIKELNIKINVEEPSSNTNGETQPQVEKNKIIEACVEQVLEILAEKEER